MGLSVLDRLALLPPRERDEYLDSLTPDQLDLLFSRDWSVRARPEQTPPPGTWAIWLVTAGRGWGKTDTAANYSRERIRVLTPRVTDGRVRWFAAGPTRGDVKKTMFEGETGFRSVFLDSELKGGDWETAFNRSELELKLSSGAIIQGFSSETPDRARGPQHHGGWVDEPATFKDVHLGLSDDSTMSNLLLGLRLDPDPRMIITGTPKPNKLIRELVAMEGVVRTVGRTRDNLHNLSDVFKNLIVKRYAGTRLGRQELDAEILDDLGNMLHPGWFRRAARPPWPADAHIIAVRYWDLASGVPTDNNPDPDYTVGAKVLFDPERRFYWIDDITRFRKEPGDREVSMGQLARIDFLPEVWMEKEPGNAGKVQLMTVGAELERFGVSVYGNPATGKKEIRAEVLANAAQQGRVYLSERAPWWQDFSDEMEEFPKGAHDDQVDAVVGAFQVLLGGQELEGSAGDLVPRR